MTCIVQFSFYPTFGSTLTFPTTGIVNSTVTVILLFLDVMFILLHTGYSELQVIYTVNSLKRSS